jgi:4-azaleucine resistance transporter AzlC
MRQDERNGYRGGARAVLPLAIPVVVFGASFGALARAAGMGWLDPVVMSATTFAGSAQFAAVSIMGGGGGIAAAVAAALLLNARYAPIGLSVAHVVPGRGWRRLLRSQLIVDESWAVSRTPDGFDGHRLVGAGILLYVTWVGGTLVGSLGARFLQDPEALGLDAAFPAIFVALLLPLLRTRRARVAALGGAGIALALTPVAPVGIPIIAAAAAALVGWREER